MQVQHRVQRRAMMELVLLKMRLLESVQKGRLEEALSMAADLMAKAPQDLVVAEMKEWETSKDFKQFLLGLAKFLFADCMITEEEGLRSSASAKLTIDFRCKILMDREKNAMKSTKLRKQWLSLRLLYWSNAY